MKPPVKWWLLVRVRAANTVFNYEVESAIDDTYLYFELWSICFPTHPRNIFFTQHDSILKVWNTNVFRNISPVSAGTVQLNHFCWRRTYTYWNTKVGSATSVEWQIQPFNFNVAKVGIYWSVLNRPLQSQNVEHPSSFVTRCQWRHAIRFVKFIGKNSR